jgi:four helix bundle protein
MSSQSEQLKARTMAFALKALQLVDKISNTHSGQVVARQLAKSATSVGANYRACCNARSRVEFIAKLGVVVEETDESVYWLEMLNQSSSASRSSEVAPVLAEARELRAIFAKALGTARANLKMTKSPQSK